MGSNQSNKNLFGYCNDYVKEMMKHVEQMVEELKNEKEHHMEQSTRSDPA